jgi:hypothetical protein
MRRERYPGERLGLRLFLGDLAPLVLVELGCDALLLHAIRRALRSNALDDLRRARRMFNLLPKETKRRLSLGIVARQRDRPGTAGVRKNDGQPEASAKLRSAKSLVNLSAAPARRQATGREPERWARAESYPSVAAQDGQPRRPDRREPAQLRVSHPAPGPAAADKDQAERG